jgi:hypothetical protein
MKYGVGLKDVNGNVAVSRIVIARRFFIAVAISQLDLE